MMDPSSIKHYHEHEFDAKVCVNTFFSTQSDKFIFEDSTIFPMKQLHQALASGQIRGETLVDISFGSNLFHLFPVCGFFKEITLLESSVHCVKELEKWLTSDDDALDWSHTSKLFTELEGNSVQWHEKEELLRKTVKCVLKCDLTKENPTDPVVLPKADCLLIVWGFEYKCKDKDAFCKNLKNISSLLKVGGQLVLFVLLNASFFSVGYHKYHILSIDEAFVSKAMGEAGYLIDFERVVKSKLNTDLVDHDHVMFIIAHKEREV